MRVFKTTIKHVYTQAHMYESKHIELM